MAARKTRAAAKTAAKPLAPAPALAAGSSITAELAAITEPKKLPPLISPADVPALVWADGRALSAEETIAVLRAAAGDHLGGALGLRLRAALAPESGDVLALYLLDRWATKDYHGRWGWIRAAVAALGGDRAALALDPLIVRWSESPSDAHRHAAIDTLPALRSIGTDTALLVLMGLRQRLVKPSVLEAAIATLAAATRDRGMSLSELADRITPSLGLDARGVRTISYGPRAFTLMLDPHFEPRVRDEEGGLHEGLPPPREGDDGALASAAQAAWAVLAAELREAVKVQSFRLEQDMISARRWDMEAWTRCLKDHPLMVNFTRRLLWGVYAKNGTKDTKGAKDAKDAKDAKGAPGALLFGFRTAEDQTLVDLGDREITLPEDARIGVVHPLHLREEERLAWAQHFADYEIISPFPQLERAVAQARDDEREAVSSARFARDRFKSGVIRDTLVRRGWERDPEPFRKFYKRDFSADRVVVFVHLDPGISAGSAVYDAKDQAIPRIEFRKKVEKRVSEALPLRQVPPVVFCEAHLDVQEILVEQDLGSPPR